MPFKTFNVPSFFAGVATVLAILVVGFGGGVMMSSVLSDSTQKPNKIERRASGDTKETKLATAPVIPVAPVVTAVPGTLAQAEAPSAATEQTAATPDPAPAPKPDPQPVQAQAAPVPQAQPQPPAPQPQTTAQTPRLGPQREVSLAQPSHEQQVDPSQLSRRDQARYWREKRREERAQRHEERRKLFAERRQQEQSRRGELRSAVEQMRPADVDDDDEPRVSPPRPRVLFDGLFGPRDDD